MKQKLIFIIIFLMTTTAFAQSSFELPLWPDGAPNTNGLSGKEQVVAKNRIANVTVPTLTVYLPEKGNGMAVIMCPGGGYKRLAMDHEGFDMAPWFNERGIACAILKYRMPNGHSEVPLSDAEQAMRIVRENAAAWQIDPHRVGIMGASAGGHLASTLATHYTDETTRPDFQILLYPVICMVEGSTHGGSREHLLGDAPAGGELETRFSNERHVGKDTPPAFIALSGDDESVPPMNGIGYYIALQQQQVAAMLHVYPTGGHGWGFKDSFRYKDQWTAELEKWLSDLNEKNIN